MKLLENHLLNNHFSNLFFSNEREKNVFISYLECFSFMAYDNSIKNVLEIGAGHSTLLFAFLADNLKFKVHVIEMNNKALETKISNIEYFNYFYSNIDFYSGLSISRSDLNKYYSGKINYIGGVRIDDILKNLSPFINFQMDNRKLDSVLKILKADKLSSDTISKMFVDTEVRNLIIDLYKTKINEFEFMDENLNSKGVLKKIFIEQKIDLIFLDSGEFSSLPEWEIVNQNIRIGGYVILHDIFFPKSFKNWLVAASISANPNWKIIHLSEDNPQGLMVAKKIN